jgi:hypothetical protein
MNPTPIAFLFRLDPATRGNSERLAQNGTWKIIDPTCDQKAAIGTHEG